MTPQEKYNAAMEREKAEFYKLGKAAQRIANLHSAMGWSGGPIFDGDQDEKDYAAYQEKYGQYRGKMSFGNAALLAFGEVVEQIIEQEKGTVSK